MLSPKRASLPPCASCHALAARVHVPNLACTDSSFQCPTTTLRGRRNLAPIKPNSRSPCADWLRFMKSMSISDHGISRLYCVCKCSSGLVSAVNPPIHILAGENVCIHAISPTQFAAALASRHSVRMASGVVSSGLNTTFTGIADAAESVAAISCECAATSSSVFGPYRCWLPVTNQTSYCFRLIIIALLFIFARRRSCNDGAAWRCLPVPLG